MDVRLKHPLDPKPSEQETLHTRPACVDTVVPALLGKTQRVGWDVTILPSKDW